MTERFQSAVNLFKERGGTVRMSDAMRAGVSRRTLYAMRDHGVLTQLSRGVYRLTTAEPLSAPDLVTVAARVPGSVICLISALAFHELTTQIPHAVDIALERGSSTPRIDYPPVAIHWFSGSAFTSGVESPTVDGQVVRVYSAEKTIADVFKYRNKLGLDVAIEALRAWRSRRHASVDQLLEQARVCRVGRVIQPYLEALI